MMDMPAGNGLPDPTAGPNRRPIPGAGASPAFPARAQPGTRRQDRRPPPTRSPPSSRNTAPWCCTTPQLCVARRRRRLLRHRLGTRRPDAAALRPGRRAPIRPSQALKSPGRAGEGHRRARLQGRLCGGLDRVPLAPARRRHRATSSSTWTRCGPTRTSTSSASTTTCRCPTGATARPTSTPIRSRAPSRSTTRPTCSANIEGGEDYDWYYASRRRPRGADPHADRRHRPRQALGVPPEGHPQLVAERPLRAGPAACEAGAPTGYLPQGKPIWFTEFGCPAVDKGPNQPNVFYDPKSSESFLPYFSTGSKDDPVQRAYLEATLSYWRDHAPVSAVYGGPMLTTDHMFAWAWDARPFPDFPGRTAVWHDTPNYELGHWLTGRLGEVPLKWIIAELCAAVGVTAFDTTDLHERLDAGAGLRHRRADEPARHPGRADGRLPVRRARVGRHAAVLRPGQRAGDGAGRRRPRGRSGAPDPGYSLARAGDTDLPGAVRLSFADPYRDYAGGSVEARKRDRQQPERRATGDRRGARSGLCAAMSRRACSSRPGRRARPAPSSCRPRGWRSTPATP